LIGEFSRLYIRYWARYLTLSFLRAATGLGLDKGLERRGHTFCRYDDDCNVYVGSRLAGERERESLKRFLYMCVGLKVDERKSAVDRPWRRVFLGYTVIWHRQPRIKAASSSVEKLKGKLKDAFLVVGDAM
jgi:RNA-directed DNA polymerase